MVLDFLVHFCFDLSHVNSAVLRLSIQHKTLDLNYKFRAKNCTWVCKTLLHVKDVLISNQLCICT